MTASTRDAGRRGARHEFRRRAAAVGRGRVGVEIDQRRDARAAAPLAPACARPSRSRSARYSRDQQIAVRALFLGELEEDLLAFGVLEALAVPLEELVRVALAADADEQRLQIVDAGAQLLGALGEDAVRGALEKQERRTRFELRILRDAARA